MNNKKGSAKPPAVEYADESMIFAANGERFLDLNMGYGAMWLGHGNKTIIDAMTNQLGRYASPGYLPNAALDAANAAISALLPAGYASRGIYSTGTEAIELALRLACAETGRHHFAAIAGSMHGNSLLTGALGSPPVLADFEQIHRFPGFAHLDLDRFAQEFGALAGSGALAAFIVEPVQMTAGGHQAPEGFYQLLFQLSHQHGFLVIFDESLTGLYRCGSRFYLEKIEHDPDILIVGKGIASGFPASVVAARGGLNQDRSLIRPGSTFLNHPVACSAIAATLAMLEQYPASKKVGEIEKTITAALGRHDLRGCGAMWCLGLPDAEALPQFIPTLRGQRILVSFYDRFIRLLPSLTVPLSILQEACDHIATACEDHIA